jgi:uncharacterized protein (TIGR02271 family)
MAEMTEAYEWSGRSVLDTDGEKVGTIERIYRSLETEQPEWALVDRGLFGGRSVFVPVGSARPRGEDVLISVGRAQIEEAPDMEAERELSPRQEAALRRHYGGGLSPAIGQDAMIRSEEDVRLTKVRRPRTRVRLSKYIVTEMVTTRVPVRREEVRLEHDPITDLDADSFDEPASSDEVHEVVLHEETLVIEKRVVPTERVRMRRETITEEQAVSGEVRTERVVFERGHPDRQRSLSRDDRPGAEDRTG